MAEYDHGQRFDIDYDKLVIGVGFYSQTYHIEGVRYYGFFLKDVGDTSRVRQRILECFETTSLATTTDLSHKKFLHFTTVCDGPTGMEISAELSDLIFQDLTRICPVLAPVARFLVFDALSTILSSYSIELSDYKTKHFKDSNFFAKRPAGWQRQWWHIPCYLSPICVLKSNRGMRWRYWLRDVRMDDGHHDESFCRAL